MPELPEELTEAAVVERLREELSGIRMLLKERREMLAALERFEKRFAKKRPLGGSDA